jgi:hypothetical protein
MGGDRCDDDAERFPSATAPLERDQTPLGHFRRDCAGKAQADADKFVEKLKPIWQAH